MKQYNIRLLVDKDRVSTLYECDRDKNKECSRNGCGFCKYTTNPRYAKDVTHEEDKDEIIEDLRSVLLEYFLKGKSITDLLKNKSLNQIRKLFRFNEIKG